MTTRLSRLTIAFGLVAGGLLATTTAMAASTADAPRPNARPAPTATPAPPLPPLDGGRIYVDRDLPPTGDVAGNVMIAMNPDGTNETVVSAMVEHPYYAQPSTRLHNGRRWFIRLEPVVPEFRFPNNKAAQDVYAYEEVSGTRIRLTDNVAAGIGPACCYYTVYWANDPVTGAPDGAMAWAGVKWVDSNNDSTLDTVDLSQSGIFLARLAFDGSGGLAALSQPTAASVRIAGSGSNLDMFDFTIAPNAAKVAYSTQTRFLKVANVPSSDPATHATIYGWSGDRMDWSTGTPGKIVFPGCNYKLKGQTRTPTTCGIFTINPDGTSPVMIAARKVATTSDPTYTYFADTWWSPSGTYMIFREELWQQGPVTNTRLSTSLHRMAADGRDNVALKADGYNGLDWVSDTDVSP